MQHKINLREERDFGQKINAVFTFLQQNFKPLFKSVLFIVGPVALIAGISMGLYQSHVMEMAFDAGVNTVEYKSTNLFSTILTPSYFIAIFSMIVAFNLVYVVVYSYLKEYLEDNSNEITVDQVWKNVREKFIRSFFSLLGMMIIAYLACLIFIGFYWVLAFQFTLILVMIENTKFSDLMTRCLFLIRSKWWSTFGLLAVIMIIQGLMGIVFNIPTYIITFANAFHVVSENKEFTNQWGLILSTMFSTVGTLLLYSVSALALAFQYFNLVERKEGVGLLQEVDQIGKPNTPEDDEGDF
ncbi:hypothetical protein NF867_08470 [Solitalea sp. MAHUQ-68]|uniref:Glycerophosphoryl diester phosphodiesterase membrane domain-containing protein n=1 Tax=Solitalea agri TaxID=2953739 RepID=A0A9X2F1E4_9SPHI|nr:hypothetical protein [Solitalea agri]MCO4292892.1 hypothetical protein [Solitalea agri]